MNSQPNKRQGMSHRKAVKPSNQDMPGNRQTLREETSAAARGADREVVVVKELLKNFSEQTGAHFD